MGDSGEHGADASYEERKREFLRELERECDCWGCDSDDVDEDESDECSEDEWDDDDDDEEEESGSESDEETEEQAAARAEREKKAKERERERVESSRCTWRAMMAMNAQALERTRWTNPAPETGAAIQDMPDLVLFRVMHFLSLRDIGSLARVCLPVPTIFCFSVCLFRTHLLSIPCLCDQTDVQVHEALHQNQRCALARRVDEIVWCNSSAILSPRHQFVFFPFSVLLLSSRSSFVNDSALYHLSLSVWHSYRREC